MAFYQGKAFRVQVGGKNLLHEIEFNFGISNEFQELASKDVENDVNPGKQTYSLSGNGYAENTTGAAEEDVITLMTWAKDKSKKAFEIADSVSGHLDITGNAYCESCEITGNNDEVVTYSITLRVTDVTLGTTV